MPLYSIKGPDGRTYSIEGPEGATRDQVISAIQRKLIEQEEAEFLKKFETQPKPEEQSVFRSIADVPLAVGRGAVQGVRMIAEAFGAGNPVAESLSGVENYIGDLMSAQSKADAQEVSRIMKEAEDKGLGAQLGAALKALTIAPVDLVSQALGTAAPMILGGLAGVGARGIAAGRALTAAEQAATATGVSTGLGATMGAGVVKGTIYSSVKDALMEAGQDEATAEAKAQEAQAYGGENWGSILAGTVLGGVAGRTGVEKMILGRFAAKEGAEQALLPAAGRGAVTEAVPEAVQAGQEKMAENIALQKFADETGEEVPLFRGVAGQAALEGLVGGALGAGVGAVTRTRPAPVAPTGEPTEPQITEEQRAAAAQVDLGDALAQARAGVTDVGTDEDADYQAYLDSLKPGAKPPTPPTGPANTITDAEIGGIFKSKGSTNRKAFADLDFSTADIRDKLKANFDYMFNKSKATPEQRAATLELVNSKLAQFRPDLALFSEEELSGKQATPPKPPKPPTGEKPIDLNDINSMSLEEVEALMAKMGGKLDIGDDEIMRALIARRAELLRQQAAPTQEAVTERKVQLDDKGNVAEGSPTQKKIAQEFLGKVKDQYEVARLERFMVEETDLKEAKDVKGVQRDQYRRDAKGNLLSSKEALARQKKIDEQRLKEAPEAAQQETDAEAALALELEMAKRAYEEAVRSGDPEAIVDAQRALTAVGKKEAPSTKPRKALPIWDKLTPDEKQVYLDGLSDPYDPIGSALTKLISYRDLKEDVSPAIDEETGKKKEWNRNDAIGAYEINRAFESREQGISFPSWANLSDQQREDFINWVPKESDKGPIGTLVKRAFRNLGRDIVAKKGLGATTSQAGKQLIEKQQLQESEPAAQRRARIEEETEELSLEQRLPEDAIQLVKNGDTNGVIEYLRKNAVGVSKGNVVGVLFDKVTSKMNRLVAGSLSGLGLKTKMQYVDTNDFIAYYDAKTDTVYVGNRGLNETAVLHELVHAATVKVIFEVKNKIEKDPRKIEAVKRLEELMDFSKRALWSYRDKSLSFEERVKRRMPYNRFNRAFLNIYEFVAYAMTDPKFL